ncbi:MAG TPA: twin-arginine translocation signal domain-containing protein, partial [Actinoplanes sp.]
MSTNRRNFLRGLGVGAAGLAIGPEAFKAAATVAFHGVHQAGIVTAPQAHATHVSFDLIVDNRSELTELFHTITDRARFLT